MTEQTTGPKPGRVRWFAKRALVTAVASALLITAAPQLASAAVHTGTRGCSGQYGTVRATTTGYTEVTAPGSTVMLVYGTSQSSKLVTANRTGGGYWRVYGSSSALGIPG